MIAYPPYPVKVTSFRYQSELHLCRTIQAVRRRTGEDALYIVEERYDCSVLLETPSGAEGQHHITVPHYLMTDLSSVPRLARPVIGRVGPHLEASIVHDWLYVAWQAESIKPTEEMRRFADDVFLAAMVAANVTPWKRWAIHRAVRLGGRAAFYGRDERLFAP